jgi:hypothetical protein
MTNPVNTPPARPRSVQETGLPLNFLAGLALKAMYTRGSLLGHEIAEALKLPFANVVDQGLNHLRCERLMGVKGAAAVGESSYRYAYTDRGRARSSQARYFVFRRGMALPHRRILHQAQAHSARCPPVRHPRRTGRHCSFSGHPAHAHPGIAGSVLPRVLSAKNRRRLTFVRHGKRKKIPSRTVLGVESF